MSKCILKKFKQINCGSLFPNLPWATAPGGCLSLQGLCYKGVPSHMCLWSESQAEMLISTIQSAA